MPARKTPIARIGINRTKKRASLAASGFICRVERGVQVLGVGKRPAIRPRGLKRGKSKLVRFGGVPQNPKYLAFVRCFDCILNGLSVVGPLGTTVHVHVCRGRIEAAHTGPHGRGQKAADETALPMCSEAHRWSRFSHHKLTGKFWEVWELDRNKLVCNFNDMARESEVLVQEFTA